MNLSENFFSVLPKNISYNQTKHFTIFYDGSGKKACFSGKRIQLHSYHSIYGANFTEVTEEEARLKHLGKMRCLGTLSDEYELLRVIAFYFGFQISPDYTPPIKTEIVREKRERVKRAKLEKKLEIKADQRPADRDERELIITYRGTTDKKVKDKIFRTILFQRGVNGKTWDQIIRNYVIYNKHRFSRHQDRNENDFYQDIVIALHKTIDKWFDVEAENCFSTYVWYVINCAFNRILQLLSTQKRKVSSVNNTVELDDNECSWDESISIEKTQLPQFNFEDFFTKRDLCSHIYKMFQLKKIDAPDDLKEEMLDVIRNKSTMQNSLYSLAKKYKIDVDKIFILERDLRENLRNAMYRDIILNMKFDINGDEEVAKKYRRSKGHVIKMKRQFVTTVKAKLKGITT